MEKNWNGNWNANGMEKLEEMCLKWNGIKVEVEWNGKGMEMENSTCETTTCILFFSQSPK